MSKTLLNLGGLITAFILMGTVNGEPTPAPTDGPEPPREIQGGFARYIPDENGDVDWEIKGDTANFKNENEVTLTNLYAHSYDDKIGPVTIQIPRGDYDLNTRIANAPEEWIVIRRGPLLLTGKGGIWSIPAEQVRILEDVRVLLKESDNLGLFPSNDDN